MDKILKMKEKHQVPDVSELTERIIDSLKTQKQEDEKRQKKLEDQKIELKTASSKLKSLLDELDNGNDVIEKKHEELLEHKKEIEQLKSELNELEAETAKLRLKKEYLENKKPNLKDKATLEQGVNKYTLLKEITGIRWNYETLDENTSGYVHNRDTKYVHHFEFDSKLSDEKLRDALWEEIEKSTAETEGSKDETEKDKE